MTLHVYLQNLTDEAVVALSEYCPKLHYLCVSGCVHLTDAALVALAQNCHQLTTLEVAGCIQFTDTAFQALARVRTTQYLLMTLF